MGLSSTEDLNGMTFANASVRSLFKPNAKELKAFIHAREFASYAIPRDIKWRWPTKKQELIELACERKGMPVKLTIPTSITITPNNTTEVRAIEPTVVH